MRQFPLWLALVAVTVFGTNAPLHAEDARLEKFFREYLDESFAMRPLDATRLGDHRFDHLLDDISPAARAKWLSQNQRALAQLPQQIDYKKLTRAGQIDFEIWQQDLIRSIWLAQNTDPFADDPRVYGDYANDGVYLLLTQSTRPREENIRNAVARMAFIPRLLDVAKTELKNPPKSILETAVRQNRGSIHFYESSLFELVKDPSEKEQLQRAAAPVVAALKRHQQVLDDLLPRASGDWRLGREKFGRKLELVLDADLTADQVLQMAEGEFAKVRGEMTVLARQLWASFFPKLPLPPDDEAGQREMIARVLGAIAQNHGKADRR